RQLHILAATPQRKFARIAALRRRNQLEPAFAREYASTARTWKAAHVVTGHPNHRHVRQQQFHKSARPQSQQTLDRDAEKQNRKQPREEDPESGAQTAKSLPFT